MSTQPRETYLGDGVYASFDGYQFRLRSRREDGDHIVFLDQSVISAFAEYIEHKAAES